MPAVKRAHKLRRTTIHIAMKNIIIPTRPLTETEDDLRRHRIFEIVHAEELEPCSFMREGCLQEIAPFSSYEF